MYHNFVLLPTFYSWHKIDISPTRGSQDEAKADHLCSSDGPPLIKPLLFCVGTDEGQCDSKRRCRGLLSCE